MLLELRIGGLVAIDLQERLKSLFSVPEVEWRTNWELSCPDLGRKLDEPILDTPNRIVRVLIL